MDKKKVFFDENSSKDICSLENPNKEKKNKVIIRDPETGEVLFTGFNKVIVSGSAFTAAKHFNITPHTDTPSYNTVLKLDQTQVDRYNETGIRREEIVCLFAVGIGGCGAEASQVYDVDYTKWIKPEELVPFKYQLASDDLPEYFRDKYYGRKTQGNRIAYYFKAFENPPTFNQLFSDGTPIDENIYESTRKDEVESYVQVNLKITKEDCRDWFLATTGINDAKINTLSLLTAYPYEHEGHIYYQNIRPLTKLNFPSEPLIDTSKGLDIEYHIYY